MVATAEARRRVRAVELGMDAQLELDQLEELVDAMHAQLRTQAATLAVVRTWSRRHRDTLRGATGAADEAVA